MMQEPKYPVKTVAKAIDIINHLSQDTGNRGDSISELSQFLGIGKSTVHRLLDTLQFYGYVEKDPETKRYKLGWELYKIGQVIPLQNQLFDINQNYLMDLSHETHETVNLGMLKRGEVVIISKIEGVRDHLRVNINPGEYEAIHATALGKMMLSEWNASQIRSLFDGKNELPTYTPNTISTVDALLKDERIIRQRGYAVDNEEYCLGLYCMAMAVRDYTGEIVAGISVSMPSVRVTAEKRAHTLQCLNEAADRISRQLGYQV